ncbi:MAG: AAA family ATPase, partial [Myxococcota bacterium]
HEDLFMSIEELERQGADPDPPHIKAVMTERGQWDVATAYFVYTTLPGQCVPRQSKANVTHSITRLDGRHRCRRLQALLTERLATLYDQPALIDEGFTEELAERLQADLADTAARTALPFRTAREITTMAPATVPFIVPPYLAQHSMTEITAPAKLGKSSFVLYMVACVLEGKPCLGQPTERGPVVFLTEERDTTLREGLSRAGLADSTELHIVSHGYLAGVTWPRIVAGAEQFAARVGAKILVVDTLPQFAGLQGESENHSGSALQAMGPLQGVANRLPLCVIVVRHDRKGGGVVGESGRGSSAYGGAADVIVNLRRPEGNHRSTIRSLHALSRFNETPPTLIIERIDSAASRDGVRAGSIFTYEALGSEAAMVAQEAERGILDTLPSAEEGALTLGDLSERSDSKRTALQTALKVLVRSGRVRVVGKGRKGDPRRYFLAAIDSAALTVEVPAESISGEHTAARS